MRVLLTLLMAASLIQAPPQEKDFGTKFFDDLRKLFGRLQQSELDQAFRRATAARCSELISQNGEWKQVGFLNDDRKLGDWYYQAIDDVKKDPSKYVFSGSCIGDRGPLKVVTSVPVQESYKTGRVAVRENAPVSVLFDAPSNSYTFLLPYLYLVNKEAGSVIYTEHPPLFVSKPEPGVSEEYRCKSLSDSDLTYRFLICRNRLVDREENRRLSDRKGLERRPLGSAAYQILSDGKEASSTVKLTYGDDVDAGTRKVPPPMPGDSARQPTNAADRRWQEPSAQTSLVDIGQDEFRLNFNPAAWSGRLASPQVISGQSIAAGPPPRDKDYCEWRPEAAAKFDGENAVFSLGFSKNAQSVTSVVFSIETFMGGRTGTLQCFFPRAQTPAEITVDRWKAVVGRHISIEVRR